MASDLGELLMGRPCQCCGPCDVNCGWNWTQQADSPGTNDCTLCRERCPADGPLTDCRVSGWNVTYDGDAAWALTKDPDNPLCIFQLDGDSGSAAWLAPIICGSTPAERTWYPEGMPFRVQWSLTIDSTSDLGWTAWCGIAGGPVVVLDTAGSMSGTAGLRRGGISVANSDGSLDSGSYQGPETYSLPSHITDIVLDSFSLVMEFNRIGNGLFWDAYLIFWGLTDDAIPELEMLRWPLKVAEPAGVPFPAYACFGMTIGTGGERGQPADGNELSGLVVCSNNPGCDICGQQDFDLTVPSCYTQPIGKIPTRPAPWSLNMTLSAPMSIAYAPAADVTELTPWLAGILLPSDLYAAFPASLPPLGGWKNNDCGFTTDELSEAGLTYAAMYSLSQQATIDDVAVPVPGLSYSPYDEIYLENLWFLVGKHYQHLDPDGSGRFSLDVQLYWSLRHYVTTPDLRQLESFARYRCAAFLCDGGDNTFAKLSEGHQYSSPELGGVGTPSSPYVSFPATITIAAQYVLP